MNREEMGRRLMEMLEETIQAANGRNGGNRWNAIRHDLSIYEGKGNCWSILLAVRKDWGTHSTERPKMLDLEADADRRASQGEGTPLMTPGGNAR